MTDLTIPMIGVEFSPSVKCGPRVKARKSAVSALTRGGFRFGLLVAALPTFTRLPFPVRAFPFPGRSGRVSNEPEWAAAKKTQSKFRAIETLRTRWGDAEESVTTPNLRGAKPSNGATSPQ